MTLLAATPSTGNAEPEPTPPPAGERTAGRVARWLRERAAATVVLGMLLVLDAAVRLVNLTGAPQRLDDEGTYLAQAFAVLRFGELAHYTYWYDHPPLGWLQIAAWGALTGSFDHAPNAVAGGRLFMVVVAVLSAALLWVLARRLGLSRWTAAAAVAVLALSPLAVQFQRTVYLDNIATLWVLAAAVCLCSPRQRLAAQASGAACLAVAVLSKETTLLLVPALGWLAWRRANPVTRRYAMAVCATVFGLLIACYVLAAALRNELLPGPNHVSLIDGLRFQLWQRGSGGSVLRSGSANQHTLITWLDLDPLLVVASIPAALAGLAAPRLRPLAAGYLLFAAMLLRQGYLPVPYVIAALPLAALLVCGVVEEGVRFVRPRARTPLAGRPLALPVLAVALVASAVAVQVWTPKLHYLGTADADAPMRDAEQWIAQNVPDSQRLIVDDAMWVDLVRAGRDRHDVVWFYKVDTDPQVMSWSPHGWADYDWVVATQALRLMPATGGQLDKALAASVPVAVFGAGDQRIEVRRVDHTGNADRTPLGAQGDPAARAAGERLAARLTDTGTAALAPLRDGRVDPRLIVALDALAATQPVRVADFPGVAAEDAAGRPRRQVLLSATGADAARIATFFRAQIGRLATDLVQVTDQGVLVRFPSLAPRGLLDAVTAPAPAGTASIRVLDLLPDARGVQTSLVALDGTALPPLPDRGFGAASEYTSVPAGGYILVTRPAGAPPGTPGVVRETFVVRPGAAYSLLLFTGASPSLLNVQLAPDGAPAAPPGTGWVRLVHGAAATSSLSVSTAGPGGDVVLAKGIDYGLVTGYALVKSGPQQLRLSWPQGGSQVGVDVPNQGAATLLLADGASGPSVRTLTENVAPPPAPTATPTGGGGAQGGVDPSVGADGAATAVTSRFDVLDSLPTLVLGVAVGAGAVAVEEVVRRRRRPVAPDASEPEPAADLGEVAAGEPVGVYEESAP